ncbi:MAG: T9SS type A sorting domain-containing protein [Paludibacter sp.]|nr:T9SS type A sorting domain-containing protein [Paludibacter sp.]
MKRKNIFFGLLFMSIFPLNIIPAQNSLIIKLNNGSETGTLLNSIDRITFSAGNVIFKNIDNSSNSIMLSDISNLTFGLFSGITAIIPDKMSMVVYPNPANDFIQLKNVPEGVLNIKIIRLDGAVLMNKQLLDKNQSIDISHLASGFYFLKVNNNTLKFTKQ